MRRNFWGVIDYGKHRAVGVIIGSNTQLKSMNGYPFNEFLYNNHKYKIQDPRPIANNDGASRHWIDDLITSINTLDGRLITISGYLFNVSST